MGGRFRPMATVRYKQNGDRQRFANWPLAMPHALQGRVNTVPITSHPPLSILLNDSHRIAAMVVTFVYSS